MSAAALRQAPPLAACTVSRDVRAFDLLIEDMEAALGEGWGDLGFAEAAAFLRQDEADHLRFIAIALDREDEADLSVVTPVIAAAKARGVKVILIAEDVSPAALHRLLREGGDEFVPYPLPEGELARAIERMSEEPEPAPAPPPRLAPKAPTGRGGVVIPVYGMAGGAGATTLAVNLAWELATLGGQGGGKDGAAPRVCLLDFGLQMGSVATYLDLPRREAVLELLGGAEAMDGDALGGALLTFGGRLSVLTAPHDLVPLDIVGGADVARIIEAARAGFDYVVIDMPPTVADWGEAVLNAAHLCLAVLELDLRSAQNALRFKRALAAEGLPLQKFRWVLNRAPGFADLGGKARVKRLADSLGLSIEVQLPDGGRAVAQAADGGAPLGQAAPKNPLRREVARLAQSLHAAGAAEEAARAKGAA